jgi:hypothetical protein
LSLHKNQTCDQKKLPSKLENQLGLSLRAFLLKAVPMVSPLGFPSDKNHYDGGPK